MIKELLEKWGEVNLFTRPRRFGKSLNVSMLKSFFAIDTDKSIFEGLSISKETELSEEYPGQFPVSSITLKQVTGITRDQIGSLIECGRVNKNIVQELTYRDMTNNLENIWSVLFTTGYLTWRMAAMNYASQTMRLRIFLNRRSMTGFRRRFVRTPTG